MLLPATWWPLGQRESAPPVEVKNSSAGEGPSKTCKMPMFFFAKPEAKQVNKNEAEGGGGLLGGGGGGGSAAVIW